jgi:4'-phosphopantetheinyl transferase
MKYWIRSRSGKDAAADRIKSSEGLAEIIDFTRSACGSAEFEFPRLDPGHIHVWQADLRSVVTSDLASVDILSSVERQRAARYVRARDNENSAAKWSILRALLATYLNLRPENLQIERSSNGKPFLVSDGPVEFSISSSGDLAVFAFCADYSIGVDVERYRPLSDYESVAQGSFALSEWAQLRYLVEDKRAPEFLRYWACKEALLKADGAGLRKPLDHFVLGRDSDTSLKVVSVGGSTSRAKDWWLQNFSPNPEFAAAVAAAAVPKAVRYFDWKDLARSF